MAQSRIDQEDLGLARFIGEAVIPWLQREVAGLSDGGHIAVGLSLSGLMAGLATFAVLIIINVVARNWREVTNGTTGMTAVPTTANATNVLVWVFAAIAVAWSILPPARTWPGASGTGKRARSPVLRFSSRRTWGPPWSACCARASSCRAG